MFGDAAPEHHPAAPSTAKFCVQEIEKAGGVGCWGKGSAAEGGGLWLWENKDLKRREMSAAPWDYWGGYEMPLGHLM